MIAVDNGTAMQESFKDLNRSSFRSKLNEIHDDNWPRLTINLPF